MININKIDIKLLLNILYAKKVKNIIYISKLKNMMDKMLNNIFLIFIISKNNTISI